ncbi:MAG TPA: VTT domain-containing protein [Gammaproteobacteria bacterium]|nr:VTT domain-containing protein [Gammaproteobacteria bacterium]
MSLVLHFFGDRLFAGRLAPIAEHIESGFEHLGYAGYVLIVASYALCSFFFIPLLIPLNIASGALYGPYVGTAVAVASIAAGSAASAVSVRHVFTGLQSFVERRPGADKILQQIGVHGSAAVLLLRLAFIVPYLWQNVVLALAPITLKRLVLLTALGSLPGAAVYSLLGAGLMKREDASSLAGYLLVPLLLLAVVAIAVRYLKKRYAASETS